MRNKIVIIGGGQAGGRLCELLARDDTGLDVTLLCAEPHPPYERPPLSKELIKEISSFRDYLIWRPGNSAWERIDVRLGARALSIDRLAKAVVLDGGERVPYDKCVIATGSSVRPFPVPGAQIDGVLSLRTYDDAVAIASRLPKTGRLLVVGGGFIGLEVASVVRGLGIEVHVVEASDRLLSRIVPGRIAAPLLERHRSAGVTFDFGIMVDRFLPNGRGKLGAAVLSNGVTVDCDLALLGVGVYPNVEIARAAGLETDVGVCVDAAMATSDGDILACGDVAAFWHPLFGRRLRIEAWHNAEDHAAIVAASLRGLPVPAPSVPFFWSDQYEQSVQLMGLPHLGVSTRERRFADGSLVLVHANGRGRIVGATGYGAVGSIGYELRRVRSLISRADISEFSFAA